MHVLFVARENKLASIHILVPWFSEFCDVLFFISFTLMFFWIFNICCWLLSLPFFLNIVSNFPFPTCVLWGLSWFLSFRKLDSPLIHGTLSFFCVRCSFRCVSRCTEVESCIKYFDIYLTIWSRDCLLMFQISCIYRYTKSTFRRT